MHLSMSNKWVLALENSLPLIGPSLLALSIDVYVT